MAEVVDCFWSIPADKQVEQLQTTATGLTEQEAQRRLRQFGENRLARKRRTGSLGLLLSQFKSPITVLLVLAAVLSIFLRDATDAAIILSIVLVSALLGFWQERGAANALEKLLAIVKTTTTVLRDQRSVEIPLEGVVPGDVVLLSAGATVPADCRILQSKDLSVDEATLTGETFPAEKQPGMLPAETAMSGRTNSLFFGTHVVSGTAQVLVARTGRQTEFAKVSERLRLRPPETDFERGVRRFGYFLMEVTLVLVVIIFAINVLLHRPVLEAFLFSVALAVGLTPQLLPAIISVNLAHGAKGMAARGVIVRRLASIENFGSMDVLCSDKTGTLTVGKVEVHAALGADGNESEKTLRLAFLNASYETGFANPIDEAIRRHGLFDLGGYEKHDEVPYDFVRKRLSVLLEKDRRGLLITKGAVDNVLAVCTSAENADGTTTPLESVRPAIAEHVRRWSQKGYRTLGVAYRDVGDSRHATRSDETDMVFLGFLVLHDPIKPDVSQTIERLAALGVSLKMITGDSRGVAAEVARQVGLAPERLMTGLELRQASDQALLRRVAEVDVFAEIEPNQKERIILALKHSGHVVGYMGDGINDASALHAADVGISMDQAADVAKETADIVLLKQDLDVLLQGVREGRRTFANTLKYVFMATSANFGNMFSMAGASLFLPFLPLLPKQILLANLLTDLPEMTIATDNVDEELVAAPRRWNIRFIRNFMLAFGTLSSVFDFLIFGVLLAMRAEVSVFRTGWFLESVISAALIVLVIRSRRPLWKGRPSSYLLIATAMVIAVTLLLPVSPLAAVLGFQAASPWFLVAVAGIIALYVIAAEVLKKAFYRGVRV